MKPKLLLGLAFVLSGNLFAGDTSIRVTTLTTTTGYSNSVDFMTQTVADGTNSSNTTETSRHLPGKNEIFSISEKTVFTRDGQTNLVRSTQKDGVRIWSDQVFYHDGKEVGEYSGDPCGMDFVSEGGSPYSIRYKSCSIREAGCPDREPDSIIISDKNKIMVDWFICTNGLFYPVESRLIKEHNDAIRNSAD
jgi:hypothetical protein